MSDEQRTHQYDIGVMAQALHDMQQQLTRIHEENVEMKAQVSTAAAPKHGTPAYKTRYGSAKCYECGKVGHLGRDCWQRLNKKGQEKESSRGKTVQGKDQVTQ